MPAAADIRQFLAGQLFETPRLPSTSFKDKTVIVTGANSGLGLEASKHLVGLGVTRLIMACRNQQKGETARKAVLAVTQQDTTVEIWPIDMADKSSVVSFAKRASSQLDRIDAVLLNAGIDTNVFEMADGDESTLTVNFISTFLLARLMLPKLVDTTSRTGSHTRLTIVGSSIHAFASDDQLTSPEEGKIFLTLNDSKSADMSGRYFLSKLMVGLCIRELAKEVDKRKVVVNCVNPGWCKTNLFRVDDGGMGGRIGLHLIGRTSEEGSRALVHALNAGQETHGQYLSECKVKAPSAFIRSASGEKTQKRLWVELKAKLEAVRL